MWKPLIRCSIMGGIVVFLWLMVSWMILPLHKMTLNTFKDPSKVQEVLLEQAPKDGIYVLPPMEHSVGPREVGELKREPYLFVNVRKNAVLHDMVKPMVIGVITQIIGAFLITYLLLKAKAMKYWGRVCFVTVVGVTLGLLCAVPEWNWWHFPLSWAIFLFFDHAIGWFLGGIIIAKLVKN